MDHADEDTVAAQLHQQELDEQQRMLDEDPEYAEWLDSLNHHHKDDNHEIPCETLPCETHR